MPGLPNTRLLHRQFQQHHRPVADGQLTGWCRIERLLGGTVWDDVQGRDVPAQPAVVYVGACRYQYLSASGQPVVADAQTPLADVRVTLPADGTVYRTNDVVSVVDAPGNPDLVGRTLSVVSVSGSSISWQRDLVCQLRQPTTR